MPVLSCGIVLVDIKAALAMFTSGLCMLAHVCNSIKRDSITPHQMNVHIKVTQVCVSMFVCTL